jgi:hypothetical protein
VDQRVSWGQLGAGWLVGRPRGAGWCRVRLPGGPGSAQPMGAVVGLTLPLSRPLPLPCGAATRSTPASRSRWRACRARRGHSCSTGSAASWRAATGGLGATVRGRAASNGAGARWPRGGPRRRSNPGTHHPITHPPARPQVPRAARVGRVGQRARGSARRARAAALRAAVVLLRGAPACSLTLTGPRSAAAPRGAARRRPPGPLPVTRCLTLSPWGADRARGCGSGDQPQGTRPPSSRGGRAGIAPARIGAVPLSQPGRIEPAPITAPFPRSPPTPPQWPTRSSSWRWPPAT